MNHKHGARGRGIEEWCGRREGLLGMISAERNKKSHVGHGDGRRYPARSVSRSRSDTVNRRRENIGMTSLGGTIGSSRGEEGNDRRIEGVFQAQSVYESTDLGMQ